MLKDILSVIKFEFNSMRMSSRIWIFSAIFIVIGLLATSVYSKSNMEDQIFSNKANSGIAETAILKIAPYIQNCKLEPNNLTATDCQLYSENRILTDCEKKSCDFYTQFKQIPVLNLASYLILLYILPFVIIFICFDDIAIDTQHRTVSFPILRTTRARWFIGKVLSYTLFITALLALLEIATVITATIILPNYATTKALAFSLKTLLTMLPICFCYVSIVSFCSSTVKAPFTSMLFAFCLLLAFAIINVLGAADLTGLKHYIFKGLSYICPNHYNNLPWLTGFIGLLKAQIVYTLFGIAWSFIGITVLKHRDV